MGRQHVRDGVLAVTQQKTAAKLAIPTHPSLKFELGRLPSDHLTFLTTAAGKPFSRAGYNSTQMATREGLEPPTLALGKLCSIRLSYRATRGG